ncbi:undecaprenyldiphospho-muramoylpentapeptide beta-N-acetylglucosaminyltransferase [Litchfieldella xinjiangensis]|uniref:undecaprenyldiphospho-muramoylpentapeptide beta-N-acetylglucosaminyltransferase n=1 Tax=Litchfieldella xinjiangensis TaxID=1166948 RepID=UPI000B06BD02
MTPAQPTRVMVMAGGTGGHVIPALSLAGALQSAGCQVEWLGSPRGLENRLVPEAGFTLHRVAVAGLRGNGVAGWLMAPIRLTRAIWQAHRIIRRFDPHLVVGLGGFASGPGGLAAWLLRRPLVIHEQNAIAGMTNKALAKLATRVYAAFPGAFPDSGCEVIGNPVRDDIAALGNAPRGADEMTSRRLRLLIVGGSLGALSLNQTLPDALARLPEAIRPEVRHQAGRDKEDATRERYRDQAVDAEVTSFIDDMAAAYEWADLIVCRAGALTVAELAAAAKPSLLVPFPHAVDDHQTINARVLVNAGAARLMSQSDLTPDTLGQCLEQLLEPDTLARMAAAARQAAHLDATRLLMEGCMETRLER